MLIAEETSFFVKYFAGRVTQLLAPSPGLILTYVVHLDHVRVHVTKCIYNSFIAESYIYDNLIS